MKIVIIIIIFLYIYFLTFTHLADAFIQSDLQAILFFSMRVA